MPEAGIAGRGKSDTHTFSGGVIIALAGEFCVGNREPVQPG